MDLNTEGGCLVLSDSSKKTYSTSPGSGMAALNTTTLISGEESPPAGSGSVQQGGEGVGHSEGRGGEEGHQQPGSLGPGSVITYVVDIDSSTITFDRYWMGALSFLCARPRYWETWKPLNLHNFIFTNNTHLR